MNKVLSMSMALALTAGAVAGGGTAWAADSQGPADGPGDRTFISLLVRQDGKPRQLVAGTTIRLTFTEGRLAANAGCNTMSGAVKVTGETLVIDRLATTKMACDQSRHEQDGWLETFLLSDPTWSLSEGTLTLRTANIEIILGERSPAREGRFLNRYWIVETVLADRVVYPVPPGVHVSLIFREVAEAAPPGGVADRKIRVSGILICNSLGGTGTVRGDTITIDGIVTTVRACLPDDPRVHTGVLTALNGVSNYWIDDDRLTIAKPTGPGLILRPAF